MAIGELMKNYASCGHVAWIGIRPQRRSQPVEVDKVEALEDVGLAGDHYASKGGSRQVTLIQGEHLDVVGSFLNKTINPGLTRRNIVVRGINLLSLKGKAFAIGDVLLLYTGECHPCSRMEENLGQGGYNAMRGHGGITARILRGGVIRRGDEVSPADHRPDIGK